VKAFLLLVFDAVQMLAVTQLSPVVKNLSADASQVRQVTAVVIHVSHRALQSVHTNPFMNFPYAQA